MHLRTLSLTLLFAIPLWGAHDYTVGPDTFELEPVHMVIPRSSVQFPEGMKDYLLVRGAQGGYRIHNFESSHTIPSWDVDKNIRDITREQLVSFLASGYIRVIKGVHSAQKVSFSLESKVRGPGGGPTLAAGGYVVAKLFWWAIPVMMMKDEISSGMGYLKGMWTDNDEKSYQDMLRISEENKRRTLEKIINEKPYMKFIEPQVVAAQSLGWHLNEKGERVTGQPEILNFDPINLNFPKHGSIRHESYGYNPDTHVSCFSAGMPSPLHLSHNVVASFQKFDASNQYAHNGHNMIAAFKPFTFNIPDRASPERDAATRRFIFRSISIMAHTKTDVIDPILDLRDMYGGPQGFAETMVQTVVQKGLEGGSVTAKEVVMSGVASGIWNGTYAAAGEVFAVKIAAFLMMIPGPI
jgi:hypothetical protein